MLVAVDQAPSPRVEGDQHEAEPAEDVDPSGLSPLCDEARFAELVDGMVTANAPRLFAVVQECGERVDARIAAWGLAFEDHVAVILGEGDACLRLPSPEVAVCGFARCQPITGRLVWVNPDAASQLDDEQHRLTGPYVPPGMPTRATVDHGRTDERRVL